MLLECFFLLCFFLSPTPLFIFFFTVPSLSSEQKQRKRDKNQLGFRGGKPVAMHPSLQSNPDLAKGEGCVELCGNQVRH